MGTEIGTKRVTDPHPRKVTITGSNPYILVDDRCRDRHSKKQLGVRYDKGRVAVDWDIWRYLSNLKDRLRSSLSEVVRISFKWDMKERTTVTMGVIEFDPDRPETRMATNFRIGIELESVGKSYPKARSWTAGAVDPRPRHLW